GPGDPVALLVAPHVAAAGLDRDAAVPQLLLVPLEHPLEGAVALRLLIARHRRPDLPGGEEAPGRQQADDQVQLAFRLLPGHLSPSSRCTRRPPSGRTRTRRPSAGAAPVIRRRAVAAPPHAPTVPCFP